MTRDSMKNKKIVITALLAAIICIMTTFFHIPIGTNGGYVHVGDAFIYLAAAILPLPYAIVASSVGAGLADLFSGAAIWIIPTIIIKPILVLYFTNKNKRIMCFRNIIAVVFAGITGVLLYCFAEYIFFGNWTAAFYMSFISLIQPIGSGMVFLLLAAALDRIKFKSKVSFKKI